MKIKGRFVTGCCDYTEIELTAPDLASQLTIEEWTEVNEIKWKEAIGLITLKSTKLGEGR